MPPPTDRGYILRYDLDAEHLNAGFWPGDEGDPRPQFFAYLVPEPPDCASAAMSPSLAAWAPQRHEWTLPYDVARESGDPKGALHAVRTGGWDENAFRYERPRQRNRRARSS